MNKEIQKMQVLVLLGGLGTRLSSIETDTPKAMMDIYGKPFFYYQLQLMKWQGLRNFIFCIGHKGEVVKDFFGDGRKFGVNIKYSYDGKKLMGTGGALRKALPLLKKDFMVMYGDSYMDVDFSEIIYMYYKVKEEEKQKGLMAIFKNKNLYDKSNVIFRNNRLLKYEKENIASQMEYIDYGICVLNKNIVKEIPKAKYIDLSDIYHDLVNKRLIAGYEVRNRFYEIGTPNSLNEFKNYIYHRSFLKKPAVFLDRDGTLNEICFNEDTGQLDSPLKPEELRLLPRTISALRIIKSIGYILVVITNQPAAAKGKTTLRKLYEVNNRFKDILAEKNIYLDDSLICPHHPIGSPYSREPFLIKSCNCRKPKIGLLKMAIDKFNIDTANSFMVGDSYTDCLAGKSTKIKSVFIGNYKCDTCKILANDNPDYIFDNLYDFAYFIKNKEGKRNG